MSSLEELFCSVDDFCQEFEPRWQQHLLEDGLRRRSRTRQMCLSEIMTILIAFHQSQSAKFQSFLHTAGERALAASVPSFGELQPLCGVDTIDINASKHLPV